MKQIDRERIHAALVGEIPRDFPALCKELEEMCAEDVRRLEPIIDEIVERECAEAWLRGVARDLIPAAKVTH